MKTIIIPTDFSQSATTALHYGIEMAKAINAEIHLLHVYQVPVSFTDTPVVLLSVDELKNAAEKQINMLKNEVEHIAPESVKIHAAARLGSVPDEIANYCNEIKPFAVVMGSKGKTGLEKVLFGSNTLTVIRQLIWPVISVPSGTLYGDGIRKIGFACDFKDIAETTPVAVIMSFQKEFNAELHILNVGSEDATAKLGTADDVAGLYKMFENVKPSYHFIKHNSPEEGISEFAETNNLDLLIAIPKKHKLLESLFKTSSTKQLVYHSHIPVMCVHE